MEPTINYKEACVLATLATISTRTDSIDITDNELIAITAAGTITGTYLSEPAKKDLENDPIYIAFEKINNYAVSKSNGTHKAILLKDAKLLSGNGISQGFRYIYLFIEDIIALSFGRMNAN